MCTLRVRAAVEGVGVLTTTEHTADVRVWEVDGLNWRQGQQPPPAAVPRAGRIWQSAGCRDQGGWAQGRTASEVHCVVGLGDGPGARVQMSQVLSEGVGRWKPPFL